MDINWLSVVLHVVAARFRIRGRIVLLVGAWLVHALTGGQGSPAVTDAPAAVLASTAQQAPREWSYFFGESRDVGVTSTDCWGMLSFRLF